MKYRIIGFNDEVKKGSGPSTRFLEFDRFDADELPTQAVLRAYATQRGYLPRKRRGVHPTKCEPVYLYLEGR